ncbi:hypothetical protein I302_108648 [Kwoniella bestiolae CBS 10118]|uniref:Very-long-chain (3R)-3-hydroxyacyl-CoA dehydratase n=1 Tax=Kwoniella bestiolae CBS 10118 TaxID=1296100 RepID=A0A1B9FTQ2_9TREE|nr:3-hydroxy acyl-CoA dehydratase [Kwoniella bestiolae CBS 10118]OCF22143.1 3-hydroxy acyl-CoA dehydratase [Kwoniella bestiolae CBS 10118]
MASKTQAQPNAQQGKERAQLEKERVQRKGHEVKSSLTPVKIYLLGYNALSALLWGHLLYITVLFVLTPRSTPEAIHHAPTSFLARIFPSTSSTPSPINRLTEHLSGSYDFKGLGWKTKYVQSLAVLEIVHTALGWVRSPLGTVASQVFSRVWTVWGVVEAVPEVTHSHPLFTTMLFAWSLTEVIRYTFYFLSLLNIQSPIINYLRYTTFIPLYPLGASSEAFLAFSTLPPILPFIGNVISNLPVKVREVLLKTNLGRELLWNLAKSNAKGVVNTRTWGLLEVFRLVMFFVWWPSLYVLYTYMFKQRRKVLGGKGKGKVVGGANKAR